MINAVAIDDEQAAINVLKHYAEKIGRLNLCATFLNPIEAVDYINKNNIGAVFLDINMPDIKGIDIPEMLTTNPAIIFTTAFTEYAVKSYELNAIDYLVKPISYKRFLEAIQKIEKWPNSEQSRGEQILFIKSGVEHIRMNVNDIQFVSADGVYIKFITKDNPKSILCRTTLAEIQKNLSRDFVQVHRSYIVNTNLITRIKHNQIYIDEVKIPISRTYKNNLYKLISSYKIGF